MAISVIWNHRRYLFYLSEAQLASQTLGDFKQRCSELTRLPKGAIKLVFCGGVLKDDSVPLVTYGIEPTAKLLLLANMPEPEVEVDAVVVSTTPPSPQPSLPPVDYDLPPHPSVPHTQHVPVVSSIINVPVLQDDDLSAAHPPFPPFASSPNAGGGMSSGRPNFDQPGGFTSHDRNYFGPMQVPVDVYPSSAGFDTMPMPTPASSMNTNPFINPEPAVDHHDTHPMPMPMPSVPVASNIPSNTNSSYSAAFAHPLATNGGGGFFGMENTHPSAPNVGVGTSNSINQSIDSISDGLQSTSLSASTNPFRNSPQWTPASSATPVPVISNVVPEVTNTNATTTITSVPVATEATPDTTVPPNAPPAIAYMTDKLTSTNPEEQQLIDKLYRNYDEAVKLFLEPTEEYERDVDDFVTQFILNFHAPPSDEALHKLRRQERGKLDKSYNVLDHMFIKHMMGLDELTIPRDFENARALRKRIINYVESMAVRCEGLTRRGLFFFPLDLSLLISALPLALSQLSLSVGDQVLGETTNVNMAGQFSIADLTQADAGKLEEFLHKLQHRVDTLQEENTRLLNDQDASQKRFRLAQQEVHEARQQYDRLESQLFDKEKEVSHLRKENHNVSRIRKDITNQLKQETQQHEKERQAWVEKEAELTAQLKRQAMDRRRFTVSGPPRKPNGENERVWDIRGGQEESDGV
ncbi:hypothetical protein IWQ62_001297, partial [Dispira parvispora]